MTDTHKLNDGPDTHKFGGNPAFPRQESVLVGDAGWEGMSLRQYAAIKLRVPDSGLPWLDVMIEKSRRDDLAEKIAAIYMQDVAPGYEGKAADYVICMADAMLIARGK